MGRSLTPFSDKTSLAKMTIEKNYHTHTWRCKHASQDVSAYCQAAVDCGLTVLGISDHTALPDNRWHHIRMDIDELPVYCETIDQAGRDFPQLTVLKSAECEYATEYDSFSATSYWASLNSIIWWVLLISSLWTVIGLVLTVGPIHSRV